MPRIKTKRRRNNDQLGVIVSVKIDKLEEKVDKVKDDVTEIKVDIAEVKMLVHATNEKVAEHISGDNKIISKLEPILEQLGEMVQDHTFQKMKQVEQEKIRKAKASKYQAIAVKLGIVSVILGIFAKITDLI